MVPHFCDQLGENNQLLAITHHHLTKMGELETEACSISALLNASARLTSSYRRVQSGPVLTPKEWLSQRLSVTIQLSTTRATLRRLAGGLDSFQ